MNEDIECFLSALRSFARLSPADQLQLISDVEQSTQSPERIQSVRMEFAESIDGCFDEDIADGLRYGATPDDD
jgi:hypothetical protein